MKLEKTRLDFITEYQSASDETMFTQETVAAIRDCSIATVIRERWLGIGIPFVKDGRKVRYRKWEIRAWLIEQKSVRSTTAAQIATEEKQTNLETSNTE